MGKRINDKELENVTGGTATDTKIDSNPKRLYDLKDIIYLFSAISIIR